MSSSKRSDRVPARREPPPFRRATVRAIEDLTPRLRRVVLGGPELDGFEIDEPAASVRLLLPRPEGGLELPTWTGNQFELADGSRAPIRTFTPRRFDSGAAELSLDIVVHGGGAASTWAAAGPIGDEVAVSGPGRGYRLDPAAAGYLLAGDETALPAIAQLLEELPESVSVRVIVEIGAPAARLDLPAHAGVDASWPVSVPGEAPGTALVAAVTALETIPAAVWVAGEAAAMQKIRRHLFEERGRTRSATTVRGYWKQGRSA